jgi:hypothetical protein
MSPNKTRLSLERKIDGGTLGADLWVKARTECIIKIIGFIQSFNIGWSYFGHCFVSALMYILVNYLVFFFPGIGPRHELSHSAGLYMEEI